jgi:hypothetical protein
VGPEHLVDVHLALASFNKLVQRAGLIAYLDKSGWCYLRSTGTGMSSASFSQKTRPLSQEELAQRQKLADFLDTASEGEFTEKVLAPLFRCCNCAIGSGITAVLMRFALGRSSAAQRK